MHPRNKHSGRYDFKALIKALPELSSFVIKSKRGEKSINFSDPKAVKALNKALLKHFYHISWDIPDGYLCPPIPGRADYIHHVADILKDLNKVTVLDIGTGANCIYPLIGYREYGWRFIGSDIDKKALASAQKIVDSNDLNDVIELRLQPSPSKIFEGILQADEKITLSICNPPFHSSLKKAAEGTKRKWKNLQGQKSLNLNFGGMQNELACPGGEVEFLKLMIKESVLVKDQCKIFSSLISSKDSLAAIYDSLHDVKAKEIKTIDMTQGQKKSRIVTWSF